MQPSPVVSRLIRHPRKPRELDLSDRAHTVAPMAAREGERA